MINNIYKIIIELIILYKIEKIKYNNITMLINKNINNIIKIIKKKFYRKEKYTENKIMIY